MKNLTRANTGLTEKLPIKVIQYGEGNFLRAFVDYIIDKLNKEADFKKRRQKLTYSLVF